MSSPSLVTSARLRQRKHVPGPLDGRRTHTNEIEGVHSSCQNSGGGCQFGYTRRNKKMRSCAVISGGGVPKRRCQSVAEMPTDWRSEVSRPLGTHPPRLQHRYLIRRRNGNAKADALEGVFHFNCPWRRDCDQALDAGCVEGACNVGAGSRDCTHYGVQEA